MHKRSMKATICEKNNITNEATQYTATKNKIQNMVKNEQACVILVSQQRIFEILYIFLAFRI